MNGVLLLAALGCIPIVRRGARSVSLVPYVVVGSLSPIVAGLISAAYIHFGVLPAH